MDIYTTRTDAISYDIIPALGDMADDYDLDRIFDLAYDYDAERQGFVSVVNEDAFWEIVASSDLTAEN